MSHFLAFPAHMHASEWSGLLDNMNFKAERTCSVLYPITLILWVMPPALSRSSSSQGVNSDVSAEVSGNCSSGFMSAPVLTILCNYTLSVVAWLSCVTS